MTGPSSEGLPGVSRGGAPWDWSPNGVTALGLGLCVLVAVADAVLGHRVILIGLLIVGPCCAVFTGRSPRIALVGAWAVGLAVGLGVPDGIWGTSTHLAFLGAVLMVGVVSTVTAFAVERRVPRETTRASVERTTGDPIRHGLLARALLLSKISVFWGLAAGAWGVTAGLLAGSLGVLGLGLNVLADVAGSIVLVWRFRVERRNPDERHRVEARASVVVAGALSIVSVTLIVAAANALAAGSAPEKSVMAMIAAGVSAVVLAPLGRAKYRTGVALHSHALKGDGTLSGIGAVLGSVALLGLLAEQVLGWWWADRCAAICVAGIAGAEAIRVVRMRPDPTVV